MPPGAYSNNLEQDEKYSLRTKKTTSVRINAYTHSLKQSTRIIVQFTDVFRIRPSSLNPLLTVT